MEYKLVYYIIKNGVVDIPKKAIPIALHIEIVQRGAHEEEKKIIICLFPIEHVKEN